MVSRKRTFLIGTLLGLFVSSTVGAVCPPNGEPWITWAPLSVTDPTRNMTGAVLTLKSLHKHPKQVAKILAHQQEVDALIDGEESYKVAEGTGTAASDLEISAFQYVKEKIFDKKMFSPYTKLNNKIKPILGTASTSSDSSSSSSGSTDGSNTNGGNTNGSNTNGSNSNGSGSGQNNGSNSGENSGNTNGGNGSSSSTQTDTVLTTRLREIIMKEFFIASDAENTSENRKKVQRNRDDYLRTLGREYARLSNTVQEKLSDDIGAVVAALNGDGSIGIVSGTDQSWKAINKAFLVDLALQIEMMELEAARFLSVQPISMVDNPEQES